jgi:hypothetical protein
MLPRLQLCSVPYALNVANGTIGRSKLVAGAVGTTTLADGAVTAAKISSLPVIGGANIALESISFSHIIDRTIRHYEIGLGEVYGENIAAGSVDQGKAPFAPVVNLGVSQPKIAIGIGTTDGANGGFATVSLAAYGFTMTPIIVCTAVPGNNTRSMMIASQDATGFVAYVRDDTNNGSFTVNFNWIAIGW